MAQVCYFCFFKFHKLFRVVVYFWIVCTFRLKIHFFSLLNLLVCYCFDITTHSSRLDNV